MFLIFVVGGLHFDSYRNLIIQTAVKTYPSQQAIPFPYLMKYIRKDRGKCIEKPQIVSIIMSEIVEN